MEPRIYLVTPTAKLRTARRSLIRRQLPTARRSTLTPLASRFKTTVTINGERSLVPSPQYTARRAFQTTAQPSRCSDSLSLGYSQSAASCSVEPREIACVKFAPPDPRGFFVPCFE